MRTVAEILADIDAVDTAWAKALRGESVSISTGSGGHTITRPSEEQLAERRAQLRVELDRARRGGISVRGATPVG